jgi:predicted extracellular nuclease
MAMKKQKTTTTMLAAAVSAAAVCLVMTGVRSASAAVIINEVYPGGGSGAAGTAYTRDYVELYNTGSATVDLTGWRVTYASATGNYGTNDVVAFGAGSFIAPGDYLLLVSGGAGAAGVAVPGANYYNGTTAGASLSGTAGSVKLFDATNTSIDTVGYGSTVTATDANSIPKLETAAAPQPTSNAFSLSRTSFSDTNNNSADFSNQTPSPTAGTQSQVVAVPEPASLGVLGLLGLAMRRRQRRHR